MEILKKIKKAFHKLMVVYTTSSVRYYYNGKRVKQLPKHLEAGFAHMEQGFREMERGFNEFRKHDE